MNRSEPTLDRRARRDQLTGGAPASAWKVDPNACGSDFRALSLMSRSAISSWGRTRRTLDIAKTVNGSGCRSASQRAYCAVRQLLAAWIRGLSEPSAPRVTVNFGSLLKDLSAEQLHDLLARLEASEPLSRHLARVKTEGFNIYPSIPLGGLCRRRRCGSANGRHHPLSRGSRAVSAWRALTNHTKIIG